MKPKKIIILFIGLLFCGVGLAQGQNPYTNKKGPTQNHGARNASTNVKEDIPLSEKDSIAKVQQDSVQYIVDSLKQNVDKLYDSGLINNKEKENLYSNIEKKYSVSLPKPKLDKSDNPSGLTDKKVDLIKPVEIGDKSNFQKEAEAIAKARDNVKMLENNGNLTKVVPRKEATITLEQAFSATKVPDKWKNESSVVLAQHAKFTYGYERLWSNANDIAGDFQVKTKLELMLERRIKLQDKNAVKKYSEYYFEDGDKVTIDIIKGKDSIYNVDMGEAIKVEHAPDFFVLFDDFKIKYKKIAIPNLEVGDIIEIVSKSKVHESENVSTYFPRLKLRLKHRSNVLYQRITVKTKDKLERSVRLINTTDPLKFIDEKTSNEFYVDQYAVEKYEKPRWFYYDSEYPLLKVQVYYKGEYDLSGLNYNYNYYMKSQIENEIDKAKNSVPYFDGATYSPDLAPTFSHMKTRMSGFLKAFSKSSNVPQDHADKVYRKILELGTKNDDDFIKSAYYFYRGYLGYKSTSELGASLQKERVNEYDFMRFMIRICHLKGVSYNVGLIVPRRLGSSENLVSLTECNFFLEISGVYYFPFNSYSCINEIPEKYEGAEVFFIPRNGYSNSTLGTDEVKNTSRFGTYVDKEDWNTLKTKIIGYKKSSNKAVYNREVTLNPDSNGLVINASSTYSGYYKERNIRSKLFVGEDPKKHDRDLVGFEPEKKTVYVRQNVRKKTEHFRKIAAEKTRVHEIKKTALEGYIYNYGGGDIVIDSVQVNSFGRKSRSDAFSFSYNYTVKDAMKLIKGEYLSLNLNDLVDDQANIKTKEKARTVGVYLPHDRYIEYNVTINIPKGYEPMNLAQLNKNIDNNVCSLSIKLERKGNQIKLIFKKIYKKKDMSAAEWNTLVTMLDEAYDFTKKAILFKKI